MKREILPHLELHPVDLGKEPGCRQMVVCGIGLRRAQMGYLSLEMADSLQRGTELLVVADHDASPSVTSTMPLRPPPRLTCQNSTAACSFGHAANRRSQNTLAPKCACAAPWSKRSGASPRS